MLPHKNRDTLSSKSAHGCCVLGYPPDNKKSGLLHMNSDTTLMRMACIRIKFFGDGRVAIARILHMFEIVFESLLDCFDVLIH